MATVSQILAAKPDRPLVSIHPGKTTYEALQLMAQYDIGAVAVIENDRLVGLVTEREYARRIVLEGKKSRNTPVRDTMQNRLLVVDPQMTTADCMTLMTRNHIRYLPVLDSGHFIGIVSIGDVVKALLADQQRNIEDLERYIQGGEYGVA